MATYELPKESYLRLDRDTGRIMRVRITHGTGAIYVNDAQEAGTLKDWLKNRPQDLKYVRGYQAEKDGMPHAPSLPDPRDYAVTNGELAQFLATLDTETIRLMMTRDKRPGATRVYMGQLTANIQQNVMAQAAPPIDTKAVTKAARSEAASAAKAMLWIGRLPWASDEAIETVLEAAMDGKVGPEDFKGMEPSGKTGFTLGDVRGVLAEEDEEDGEEE